MVVLREDGLGRVGDPTAGPDVGNADVVHGLLVQLGALLAEHVALTRLATLLVGRDRVDQHDRLILTVVDGTLLLSGNVGLVVGVSAGIALGEAVLGQGGGIEVLVAHGGLLGDDGVEVGVGEQDGLVCTQQVEVTPTDGGSRTFRVVREAGVATLDGDQGDVLALAGAVSPLGVVDSSAHGVGREGDGGHGVSPCVRVYTGMYIHSALYGNRTHTCTHQGRATTTTAASTPHPPTGPRSRYGYPGPSGLPSLSTTYQGHR